MSMLRIAPSELIFRDVVLRKPYVQWLTIRNAADTAVDFTIRPGSASRYTVAPSRVSLPENGSVRVRVTLRIERFANRKRGENGQRDTFHVKSRFFDEKFHAVFFLFRASAEAPARVAAEIWPLERRLKLGGRHRCLERIQVLRRPRHSQGDFLPPLICPAEEHKKPHVGANH